VFEIGNSLREARLRQQLEFADIERVTKIRPKYLRALEDESFATLPAQTYVKGFLRTYAEFLGLDGQLYVDEYNSRYVTREEDPPFRPRRSPRRGKGVESSVVLGAIVGIAIVFGLVIAAWKSGDDPTPGATTPALRPVVQPDLVVRAVRGTTQVEVRRGSELGEQRFLGTVANGDEKRFVLNGRLWLRIQQPNAVELVVAGRVKTLEARRPRSYLVTSSGAAPTR
jgi:cytoskeletal protein RodZ